MTKYIITGGNGFIGTNFIEVMRSELKDYEAYIIDIAPPKIALNKNEKWLNTDILDEKSLMNTFAQINPEIVVHFAAETSCLPHLVLNDYKVNTIGSEHIFNACLAHNIDFLVHTSTQFVHQTDSQPVSDLDFAPHTVYGESKVISEKMLRNEKYTFNWTIIRPTNVWGKWHLRYPTEFWKILKDGKYFHPGHKKVMRSYGYVGNICLQIIEIIKRKDEPVISKQVFYVGDKALYLLDWVNAFSLAITKKPAKVVPSFMVYALALFGSALQKFRIKFPITVSRYKSMTSDNPAPMEKSLNILGKPRYDLKEGVKITIDWLMNDFWKIKRT